jgi:uncharacterized protein (TIGR03083 family)
MSIRELYEETARSFARQVESIGADQWRLPGLGIWDVRALVGHTTRALDTVTDYLAQDEPPTVTMESAEAYYAGAPERDNSAVAERGVAAGEGLGDEPADSVAARVERAVQALHPQPVDRRVAVLGGSILIEEYLRTRVVELVVHSLDVQRATGAAIALPPDALYETLRLIGGVALATGRAEEVVLALTGRHTLPPGFNLV